MATLQANKEEKERKLNGIREAFMPATLVAFKEKGLTEALEASCREFKDERMPYADALSMSQVLMSLVYSKFDDEGLIKFLMNRHIRKILILN